MNLLLSKFWICVFEHFLSEHDMIQPEFYAHGFHQALEVGMLS